MSPKLGRETPCWDCPFRTNAQPGWLGEDTIAGFLTRALSDVELPCHIQVDYEAPDWREQTETADLCAGMLIFLRNYMKMPRDPVLAAAVAAVEKSPKVFSAPEQFSLHHSRGELRLSELDVRSAYWVEEQNAARALIGDL